MFPIKESSPYLQQGNEARWPVRYEFPQSSQGTGVFLYHQVNPSHQMYDRNAAGHPYTGYSLRQSPIETQHGPYAQYGSYYPVAPGRTIQGSYQPQSIDQHMAHNDVADILYPNPLNWALGFDGHSGSKGNDDNSGSSHQSQSEDENEHIDQSDRQPTLTSREKYVIRKHREYTARRAQRAAHKTIINSWKEQLDAAFIDLYREGISKYWKPSVLKDTETIAMMRAELKMIEDNKLFELARQGSEVAFLKLAMVGRYMDFTKIMKDDVDKLINNVNPGDATPSKEQIQIWLLHHNYKLPWMKEAPPLILPAYMASLFKFWAQQHHL